MSQFESYAPPDVLNKTLSQEEKVVNRWEGGSTMVLDAITLKNLRIVQDDGCLYEKLNFCSTAMGKRFVYISLLFYFLVYFIYISKIKRKNITTSMSMIAFTLQKLLV